MPRSRCPLPTAAFSAYPGDEQNLEIPAGEAGRLGELPADLTSSLLPATAPPILFVPGTIMPSVSTAFQNEPRTAIAEARTGPFGWPENALAQLEPC
jgi:hypothetical protein